MGKRKGKEHGELLPGTLDMLILKTLTPRAQHGYGIAQHIRQTSDDARQRRYFRLRRLLWGRAAPFRPAPCITFLGVRLRLQIGRHRRSHLRPQKCR